MSGSIRACRVIPFAIFSACLLAGSLALAGQDIVRDFESGNSLKAKCDQPLGSGAHLFCEGYIIGVAAAISGAGRESLACLPPHVTVGQVVDTATQALDQHPAERHASASSMVAWFIEKAFPCAK